MDCHPICKLKRHEIIHQGMGMDLMSEKTEIISVNKKQQP